MAARGAIEDIDVRVLAKTDVAVALVLFSLLSVAGVGTGLAGDNTSTSMTPGAPAALPTIENETPIDHPIPSNLWESSAAPS